MEAIPLFLMATHKRNFKREQIKSLEKKENNVKNTWFIFEMLSLMVGNLF